MLRSPYQVGPHGVDETTLAVVRAMIATREELRAAGWLDADGNDEKMSVSRIDQAQRVLGRLSLSGSCSQETEAEALSRVELALRMVRAKLARYKSFAALWWN